MTIPSLGFGTFRLEGEVAYNAVTTALSAGYRHIDTAQIYGNEAEVGQAIADSLVNREDIFLTTKVWIENLSEDKFIESVKESLAKLRTEYVDLLLIHWPSPPQDTSLSQVTELLIRCQQLGLTKHIGVSNFTIAQLEEIKPVLGNNKLANNQVEVHPYLINQTLRDYCTKADISVTGYMPFAVGKVLNDDTIVDIARTHQCTPAQVVIAWIQANGLVTIPSSTKAENIIANLAGLTISLSNEEVEKINQLDANDRQASPDFAPDWD